MPGLTITVENVGLMWDDMQSLLVEHWQEIAHNKQAIPLSPDRPKYEALERDNKLLAIACRKDGVMIGYAVFVVTYNLHYSTTMTGINDVFFVTKECRNSRAGLMLKKESERRLKERGVVLAVWRVKPENDWSAILLHDHYQLLETSFSKLL